eukprot:GDKJ01015636.1.p1 GENE.GDKJ01015636.1~~GDKJ01015636.1.p1  ORF type:complete len:521 (-),score=84.94 GDKJ01015636.1:32-1594(-)
MKSKPKFTLETDMEPLAYGMVHKFTLLITAENVFKTTSAEILVNSGNTPVIMTEVDFDQTRPSIQLCFTVFASATAAGIKVEIQCLNDTVVFPLGIFKSRVFHPLVDSEVLQFPSEQEVAGLRVINFTRSLLNQPGNDYYILLNKVDKENFLNILAAGLFVLGESSQSGIPAAAHRYCLFPTSSSRKWLSSRSLPKVAKNIKFTLNEVDPKYLLRVAAAYHRYRGRGEWLSEGLISLIVALMEEQKSGKELRSTLGHGVETEELRRVKEKLIDQSPALRVLKEHFSIEANAARCLKDAPKNDGYLPWTSGVISCEQGSETERDLVLQGGKVLRGDVKIEFLNFEAWIPKEAWMEQIEHLTEGSNLKGLELDEMKEKIENGQSNAIPAVQQLLLLLCDSPQLKDEEKKQEYYFAASTCSYLVGGGILCDYTVTNHCSPYSFGLGGILAKVVAETLKERDVKMWYWGMELPYMTAFSPYGGRSVPRWEFYEIWRQEAWGDKEKTNEASLKCALHDAVEFFHS